MVAWIIGIITWIIASIIWIIIGAVAGFVISAVIFLLGPGLEEEYPMHPLVKPVIQTILYIGCGLLLLTFGGYPIVVGYILGCFSFVNGLLIDVKPFLKKTLLPEE